jgi:hypothetical protein
MLSKLSFHYSAYPTHRVTEIPFMKRFELKPDDDSTEQARYEGAHIGRGYFIWQKKIPETS